MSIKAAVCFEKDAPVRIADVTLDPPRESEVRVRIAAAGVCHSDYSVVDRRHEDEVPVRARARGRRHRRPRSGPASTDLAVGDRVVLSWVAQCGECFYCRAGQPNLCDLGAAINLRFRMPDGTTRAHHDGTDLQTFSALGAMAEEVVAPGALGGEAAGGRAARQGGARRLRGADRHRRGHEHRPRRRPAARSRCSAWAASA